MPVPNPIAFTFAGIDVRWYGILIALGAALATAILCKRAPRHGLTADRIMDFVLICIPVGIIGSRIYYVLFNWSLYQGDFIRIINLRLGGLAIHGGLIFGISTALILCYRWKVRPLNLMDLAAPGIALAQAIGRWGNYFNSEAHGGPTDLPWAVWIDGQSYHPTFLYESIWCFLLFLLLSYLDKKQWPGKFEGQIFFLYGILYSVERFFVEALRTDSLMIGPLKQAQVLSLCIIILFVAAYFIRSSIGKKEK